MAFIKDHKTYILLILIIVMNYTKAKKDFEAEQELELQAQRDDQYFDALQELGVVRL